MDEETLEILLEAHAEGIHELNRMQDAIADVRDAVLELMASMELSVEAFLAMAAAEEVATRVTRQHNDAVRDGIPIWAGATAAFGGLLGGIGGFLFQSGPLVDIIIVLTLAFSAVIPVIVGATAVLTAFTLGIAALLTVVTLGVGGMAALAAGMVFLGEQAFKAGITATDPLAKIEDHLKSMAETWERAALPMAVQMIAWADSLVPRVTALGVALETWFGARLPGFLHVANQAMDGFFGILTRVGAQMGVFVDLVMARMPEFGPVFGRAIVFATDAINGLMLNLLRLSDWFVQRLPTMGPVAGAILDGIGRFMLNLMTQAGRLVDWFVINWPLLDALWRAFWDTVGPILGNLILSAGRAVDWFVEHWPEIARQVSLTWNTIREGWDAVAPLLRILLPAALFAVAAAFDYMRQHGQLVRDILLLLGATLGVLVLVLAGTIVTGTALAAGLSWLYERFNDVSRAVSNFANFAAPAFGAAIWGMLGPVGILIGALGQVIRLLGQIRGGFASIPVGGGSGGGEASGPMFSADRGGVVPGPLGAPVLALIHGGEEVLTPEQRAARGSGDDSSSGRQVVINVMGAGDPAAVARQVLALLREEEWLANPASVVLGRA